MKLESKKASLTIFLQNSFSSKYIAILKWRPLRAEEDWEEEERDGGEEIMARVAAVDTMVDHSQLMSAGGALAEERARANEVATVVQNEDEVEEESQMSKKNRSRRLHAP